MLKLIPVLCISLLYFVSVQGCLLVECLTDGRLMLCWSHHSVAVTAAKRYRQQLDYIKLAHKDMADYFLETWKYNKPLVVPEKGVQIIDTGCRYVCHQPLLLSETNYNLRRLSELWYHLLNAGYSSFSSVK